MGYTPATGTRPRDLNPEAFSPAGNGIASQEEMLSLYQRPIAERTVLMERHVGYVGFATWLSAMGAVQGASTPTVGHYENPWSIDTVKIGSVVTASTGAGTNVVVALHADSMYNTNVTTGGAAVQASYPVVGDILELYDGTQVQVTAKNVSVTPHRLTLRPILASVDLAGKITAADEYGVVTNAHGEGSNLPKGRAPRILKYSNVFQIVKHSFGSTGTELTNSVYHETIAGDPSSAGKSIYVRIKNDDIKRYEMSRSNALLFGQVADNLTSTDNAQNLDTPVNTTEGYIPFALTNGTDDQYTVGSYALADFNTLSNIYYDERSSMSSDLMCFDGPDIALETEDLFINTLDQNLAPFVDRIMPGYSDALMQYHEMMDSKPTDATLAFGYSCIQKGGFVFHLKRLSELNDVKVLGSTNYSYRNYRIVSPIAMVGDVLTKQNRAAVGYEYKMLDGYSRENVLGHIAGAGVGGNTMYGQAANGYDSLTHFLICEIAGHFAVANAIVVQRPTP